jgi:hypothetical protein
MTVTQLMETWDRIGGESSRAFALFAHYRDEGLNRSLRKTAEAFKVSTRAVEKMSSRHSWRVRVRAFDREQDRQRQLDNRAAQRDMEDRHARLGTLMQQKALARLQTMDASEMTPNQVAQFMDLGVKIERLSRGVPNEHVATSAGDPVFEEQDCELEGEELAVEVQGFLLGLEAAESNEQAADGGEG